LFGLTGFAGFMGLAGLFGFLGLFGFKGLFGVVNPGFAVGGTVVGGLITGVPGVGIPPLPPVCAMTKVVMLNTTRNIIFFFIRFMI